MINKVKTLVARQLATGHISRGFEKLDELESILSDANDCPEKEKALAEKERCENWTGIGIMQTKASSGITPYRDAVRYANALKRLAKALKAKS